MLVLRGCGAQAGLAAESAMFASPRSATLVGPAAENRRGLQIGEKFEEDETGRGRVSSDTPRCPARGGCGMCVVRP